MTDHTRFLVDTFASSLPSLDTLRDMPQKDFGGELLDTAGRFGQSALAWGIENQSLTDPASARAVLGATWSLSQAVRTWRRADNKLIPLHDIAVGGLAVMEQLMAAAGVVEAVPIIGQVARVGLSIQKAFWSKWWQEVSFKGCDREGLRYSKAANDDWLTEALSEMRGGDLTAVFSPRVGPFVEFDSYKVPSRAKKKECDRLIIMRGDSMGLGALPGGFGIPNAVESRGAWWSDFHPAAMAGAQMLWRIVLDNPHLVDKDVLRARWNHFFDLAETQRMHWEAEDAWISARALTQLITPYESTPEGIVATRGRDPLPKYETNVNAGQSMREVVMEAIATVPEVGSIGQLAPGPQVQKPKKVVVHKLPGALPPPDGDKKNAGAALALAALGGFLLFR